MKILTTVILMTFLSSAHALTLKDLSFSKYETKIDDIERNKREPASVEPAIEVVVKPACQAPNGLSVYERSPAHAECLNFQTRTQSTTYQETAKALVIRASVNQVIDK